MNAEMGGRGDRRQQHLEGGRREGSSEEGVEVPSKIDFHDPKFTLTSNPYWTNNRCTQKVIDLLSGKEITNFTPVQTEAFVPVLAGCEVIGRSQTGTGKTLMFGIPLITRLRGLAEEKGNSETQTGQMRKGRSISMIVLCPTRELS